MMYWTRTHYASFDALLLKEHNANGGNEEEVDGDVDHHLDQPNPANSHPVANGPPGRLEMVGEVD